MQRTRTTTTAPSRRRPPPARPERKLSAARRPAAPNLFPRSQRKIHRRTQDTRASRHQCCVNVDVLFSDFAAQWLAEREEERQAGELAEATLLSYRRTVRGVLIPALGHCRVRDIDVRMLRDLRASTADIPARGNQALNLARRILREAERLEIRPPHSNPVARVKPHAELASARPADTEEVSIVIEACQDVRLGDADVCRPSIAAIFELVALTGARPSEIIGLRWANVDLRQGEFGVLLLQNHKTRRRLGEKRIVLSEMGRDVIDWAAPDTIKPNPEAPVFPSYRNPSRPYSDLSRAWRRIATYAGLDDLCLRDLRSGLATNAYDVGVPLPEIQEMLGHVRIETTRRYTKISARRVASSYALVEKAIVGRRSKGRRKR